MNNKGFVLVETIITAVFVLSLFSFIIANVLPIIGDYDRIRNYDSIESIYDAHLIRKMILKSDRIRTTNDDDICLYVSNINYCRKLLSRDYLDVSKIIITNYNITSLKEKVSSFNRAIGEYIKYLPKFDKMRHDEYDFQKRLIIEFNDGRYANVELLLERVNGGGTC